MGEFTAHTDTGDMVEETGIVLVLEERDYRFGTGRLRIRVRHVDRANPVVYDGEPWYSVTAVQVTSDGADIGPRQVLVRGRRLAR